MSELPKLASDQRTIYNNCLVESKNDSALAYYLFKNKDSVAHLKLQLRVDT